MSRRNVMLGLMLVLMVALVVGIVLRVLSGPPAGRIVVSGDVRSVTRTVSAPSIAYPTMSFDVKVPSDATSNTIDLVMNVNAGARFSITASPAIVAVGTTATPGQPTVAGTLTQVNARVGDHVTTGTVLAKLDTRMLDLGVSASRLQEKITSINVNVLSARLDQLEDAQDKVASAKAKAFATAFAMIDAAIASQTAPVFKAHSDAVAARPQLAGAIAVLEATLSHLPPGNPQIPVLQAQIAKLKGQLAGIDAFLKQWPTILAKLQAGVATGRATGRAKASAAIISAIDPIEDQLHDAKKKIKNAREVLKIIRDSSHLGVTLAEVKRGQTTILAPCSGWITQDTTKGTVAVVNAPLFRIWPDEPALVDTYVDADQLGKIKLGTIADVTYDSAGGKSLRAHVSELGNTAQYPPTAFPTDIVHMTRTVRVTLQIDSGDRPPAGTPVDIAIHTD